LVRESYEIPCDTFEINAIGTANLLEGVRMLENECQIILITTDKVYHNNEWIYPYRENDRLGGYDPYSASKACSELIIDSYVNSFFNKKKIHIHKKSFGICRAGNVIGGGDWSKDRLIPDIIKSLVNRKNIIIRNPNSVRPWQHVIEPLFGYLRLGVKLIEDPLQYSNAYNFGPNISDSMTVKEVVEESIKSWGEGSYSCHLDHEHVHEAGILRLDISKAINELNWKPIMNPQIAIQRTVNFYKNFYEGKNILELMNSDINYYTNFLNEN
jgi:CDP-glucose 4,6-dehydratase